MPSAQGYALCCTLLSAFGIVFLGSIGLMIQNQPEYIKSLNVTSSAPVYEGAALYAVTLAVSMAVLYLKVGSAPDKYNDVPLSEHIDGVTNEKTPLLSR
ncbi:hypothetical protein, variant [Aphanomyces invadans]|uniref:Uncharacterized protein n=1 Tax=Aphanomyces invadans TaxID=157072 RepID=A0A024TRX4_9STRA|nr:hypothetical protein, variant [Aphanomyces invadans]ETV96097.1 hypothetical protein, variant [Aphanomyces invadans]|eukprot:XP_008875408.1 hypothetical protein, variant [Aphanomyces invadans]